MVVPYRISAVTVSGTSIIVLRTGHLPGPRRTGRFPGGRAPTTSWGDRATTTAYRHLFGSPAAFRGLATAPSTMPGDRSRSDAAVRTALRPAAARRARA